MAFLLDIAPIFGWLRDYPVRSALAHDISGGVTLGCILIGQSLAHAKLCGVELIIGPYSCMLGPVLYAVFGTCIHSSIGTGALICLLVGEVLVEHGDSVEERSRIAPFLTILVGVILTLMGVCRLSGLVRFLSRPALSGFITASALLAMLSQVSPMLGLPDSAGSIQKVLLHQPERLLAVKWPTLLLSAVATGYLLSAKRLKQHPRLKPLGDFKELVLLGLGAAFCAAWDPPGLSQAECVEHPLCVKVVGRIEPGLPHAHWPRVGAGDWGLIHSMLPGACLVALVAFLTSFAGAKKFGLEDGYQIKPFNELIAIGMCNVGGALLGAVPTSIGNTRMGIARQCGVQSQLGANVFVSIFIALAVQFFTPCLFYIPMCALNAIILIGSSHMLEFAHAGYLLEFARHKEFGRDGRMDVLVWIVGFVSTLFLGAFKGIISAVVLSLLIIVLQVVNPHIALLGRQQEPPQSGVPHQPPRFRHRWVNMRGQRASGGLVATAVEEEPGVLVFRFEGPLFYANVDQLQEWLEAEELRRIEESPVDYEFKAIIFSAIAVPFLDTTAIGALQTMIRSYADRNVLFLIANTFANTRRIVAETLGADQRRALREDLRPRLASCTTVDDFVELVHANRALSKERPRPLIRTTSSLLSLASLASLNATPPKGTLADRQWPLQRRPFSLACDRTPDAEMGRFTASTPALLSLARPISPRDRAAAGRARPFDR